MRIAGEERRQLISPAKRSVEQVGVDIRRLDGQRQFEGRRVYHTRQAFSLTIGWPALQEKAFWNSGMFCSVPSTR